MVQMVEGLESRRQGELMLGCDFGAWRFTAELRTLGRSRELKFTLKHLASARIL